MSIRILSPGLLTTVQDSGRVGHAASGVAVAGAMDTLSLRLANTLVGNAEDAAGLEITLRGPRLRFDVDSLIALSGAAMDVRCGNIAVPAWRPLLIRAGAELVCGALTRSARAYLAVAGGIDGAPTLGSRSTDLNAQLGPYPGPLKAGDSLASASASRALSPDLWRQLDTNARQPVAFGNWSIDSADWFDHRGDKPIHALAGRHFDALDTDSQRALFGASFCIGIDSNRVGFRLENHALALREPLELISAGCSVGTLQLPPGGVPIVLTCEAPPTGGYPCIAQVITVDQPRLAQHRPGDEIRFAQTDLRDAQMRYRQRELALARLRQNIQQRLKSPW